MSMNVNMDNYLSVSWEELVVYLRSIANKIQTLEEKPDIIVGIARGGLSIAHILSDMLNLPVASFTVSSYKDVNERGELNFHFNLGGRLDGKHVLVVDDVSDTGTTFIRATEYVTSLGARKVTTASVFIKPASVFAPDISACVTSAWIIFPFDRLENMRKRARAWRRKYGVSDEEISGCWEALNIPQMYQDMFWEKDVTEK